MFEFTIKKEDLLSPLLTVFGAVDKKQSLAILSNFLLKLDDGILHVSATDLEIEISAQVACESHDSSGSITVPAKKFIDIIRSLDENTCPKMICDNGLVTIKQVTLSIYHTRKKSSIIIKTLCAIILCCGQNKKLSTRKINI